MQFLNEVCIFQILLVYLQNIWTTLIFHYYMAKPKIPNQRKANLEHKKRIEQYTFLIQQVYDNVAKEAARHAVLAGASTDTRFSFNDYPQTKEAIKKLQTQLMGEVSDIIMRGTSEEWKEANIVQDLVAKKVLTAFTGTNRHGDEYSRYFETNPDTLKAFQERKDGGMNLSTRVWRLTEDYKSELEDAITAAIAPGTSATSLAAKVKQYLKYPDKRFRRIKEKLADGTIKWHLSKNAKAFHPGNGKPGVYRSSSRNAQRLARTEINMAYRTAEQTRWKQFDFVVGYEIKTTQNGHHVEDICDDLAGKYPKTFKFNGWHPQCMCYCIPILKTEDEFWADDDVKSVNEVSDVPKNFKEWIRDNEDRINAAEKRGSLPYFIRDNRDDVEKVMHPKLRKKTPLEIAAERHAARTEDDIKDIQKRWIQSRNIAIDSEIKTLQSNITIQYSDDIDSIYQGNELRERSNKRTLLRYLDALDTLGNGTKIYVPDDKWKVIFSSDQIKDGLTNGYYSASDIKHILSVIKTNVTNRVSKLPFISQLKDLHRIRAFDASGLPLKWKRDFLDVLKGLSSGSSTIRSMVFSSSLESNLSAYGINMIELSRNVLAQKFGLSNLSSKTPVQLFTEFEKVIPGYSDSLKSWRSKDFFDSLKNFVPLKTDRNEGCFFMPDGKFGYVHINPNHTDTRLRLQSDDFKKSILAHEYGHAMFHQFDWINDVNIKDIYDKWVRVINSDNGKTIKDKIEAKFKSIPVSQYGYGHDVYEQLGKISDSAQAAINGHPFLDPMGHEEGTNGYFKEYEFQLNEIIAHASENLWIENPIFKEIAPGLYKKMRELIAKKLGVKI